MALVKITKYENHLRTSLNVPSCLHKKMIFKPLRCQAKINTFQEKKWQLMPHTTATVITSKVIKLWTKHQWQIPMKRF